MNSAASIQLWPQSDQPIPEAKPLFQSLGTWPHLRLIRLCFRAGQELAKHKASEDIMVLVAEGEIMLHVGCELVVLPAGRMQPIAANVEHALQAKSDATVLVFRLS